MEKNVQKSPLYKTEQLSIITFSFYSGDFLNMDTNKKLY